MELKTGLNLSDKKEKVKQDNTVNPCNEIFAGLPQVNGLFSAEEFSTLFDATQYVPNDNDILDDENMMEILRTIMGKFL